MHYTHDWPILKHMLCKCICAHHSQVDQLTRQTYWTVGVGLCSGVNWKPEYFRVYWSCNIPDLKGLWCTTYWAIVGGTLCIAVVTWGEYGTGICYYGVLTESLSGLWTCRRSRSMIWAIGENKIYGGHVAAWILLYHVTSVSVSF